ncbi:hypothetical protein ACIQAC_21850 [Streptomyces sp. NPDC088387]|uniref:hypothetical protein n=1 Tax=Streptomyces sp. NPDC088387 TaxID=3365859 RepID=UPI0037FDF93B
MRDVVDTDELLRRLRRGRDCAEDQRTHWLSQSEGLRATDPEAAREADVRVVAYESVLRVLDEVLTPGAHDTT